MQLVCLFYWVKRQNEISGSHRGTREYPHPPGRHTVLTDKQLTTSVFLSCLILKMKDLGSCETSVTIYQPARRNILEDFNF
jgi:hypothetical protein